MGTRATRSIDLPAPGSGRTAAPAAGLTRRRFIQGTAAGLGGVALAPWMETLAAHAAPPLGANDAILILLELEGGNDGLNMIPPVGMGRYYDLRPNIAIPGEQALSLGSDTVALHPSLRKLKRRFDRGKVAVVNGVGYRPPDFSHFTSSALQMQGWGGTTSGPDSGWAGRWLDGLRRASAESLYGVTMGWRVPLVLRGKVNRPSALPSSIGDAFGVDRSDPAVARLVKHVAAFGQQRTGLGRWGDAVATANTNVLDVATRITPAYNEQGLPDGDAWLARQLALAARLINLNLGTRVFHVAHSGFDTHADQLTAHADLLTELDDGIEMFFNTLSKSWRDQTVVMVFSEFGRRPEENGDQGTDHGSAGPVLLIGDPVKGGLYGRQPRLDAASLRWWGNLDIEVDVREVYATLLDGFLRADASDVLGRRYDSVGFLR